jgi:carboxypeptidase T
MKTFFFFSLLFCFHTQASDSYKKILDRLTELDRLPDTTLFSLGKNDQGVDIMGLVLGDSASAQTRHLVVGTHHGNERAAAIVPLHFIEEMHKNRKSTDAYFVIPVLNVSGYNSSRREEIGSDHRSHDSNRDYEDPCTTKADFKLKSTTLLAQLVEREDITSAVSVHGYVGTLTYPWGTTASDYATKDDAFMEVWAAKAAKINNYRVGTHGAAIYPAAGAFEDWAYYKHGVWSYLLEIRSPSSDLKKDALSLVEFFKLSPKVRSQHLGQTVNCVDRLLKSYSFSRP